MTRHQVYDKYGNPIKDLYYEWQPKPAQPLHVTQQRPQASTGCPHCLHCQQLAANARHEGPTDQPDWGDRKPASVEAQARDFAGPCRDEVDWGTWKADTSFEGPCKDEPGWNK